jgi:hypothetical protein
MIDFSVGSGKAAEIDLHNRPPRDLKKLFDYMVRQNLKLVERLKIAPMILM